MDSDAEFNSLEPADWQIVGRIPQSSNNALLIENSGIQGVYKSVRGERPLWDFPSETLTKREMQAFLIDRHFGFNLIPSTIWIETDELGPGIIQRFIPNAQSSDVRLIGEDVDAQDWITVVKGEIDEEEIFLQHTTYEDVFHAAVFDALINNSDRKAGHLLRDATKKLWLIDHGVSFHIEDKLRTILWGWIGDHIPGSLHETLQESLKNSEWRNSWLLNEQELEAFESRIKMLLVQGMPEPNSNWPSLPSPIY